ncbi:transcriptional regulator, TetR family [Candidatus Moduliflexus flocculans]|uniref:Transcriptional regulator, TetR family n=1 Tax=Candidatus Moduliflexus flocculans TaxID=1499966 RepID=A0A0S6VTC4_9BACT|nr:transcriptional regulator, TetR family [Candidatus Moduliflexus flocculans]
MGVQERREREKHARQEAILEAAREVFFTKGLDQTTIDDVAEQAELSKGTIYLYFKSKEELYISVFTQGIEQLTQQLNALRDQFGQRRADELVLQIKDMYYAFYHKYPEYFYIHSLLYHGRIKGKIDPVIWAASHQQTRICLQVVSDILQRGIDDGLFRPVDAWKAANSLWGAATGVMMMLDDEEHQQMVGMPAKELLDYTTELLIASLRQL